MPNEQMTEQRIFSITLPPKPSLPEPRIGPGMILERGRTRIYIPSYYDGDHCLVWKRWPFCSWPLDWTSIAKLEPPTLVMMIRDGFKVIREADHTGAST